MLFNSIHFLLFFPLVTAGYFFVPFRLRWAWLLAASCYFYMAFRPVYILILAFTILVDYFAGIGIEQAQGKRRKHLLILSIAANVGVLAVFKYYNFLNANLSEVTKWLGGSNPIPFLDMLLPIGLSFHTFQSLSYTIEIYRGKQKAEHHLGVFALYVMYYPQLVAGPIERPQAILPQLHKEHPFEYSRVVDGLKQILWGFFKKVTVADRLAPFVNQVYDHPTEYKGISFLIATFFFAIQIYCDFSGYSDIALGCSRVMGIELMRNFDRPYFSTSVSQFWRRWHISLSSWFRDYVFISLGGSRRGEMRSYANLLITFLLSGLWHGANWTYVIWGGLNGFYLVVERIAEKLVERAGIRLSRGGSQVVAVFRWALTFCLICLGWIFFRARTLQTAWYIVTHLGEGLGTLTSDVGNLAFIRFYVLMLQNKDEFLLAIAGILVLFAVEFVQGNGSVRARLASRPAWVRWAVYYAGLAAVIYFGAFNTMHEFIYFQF